MEHKSVVKPQVIPMGNAIYQQEAQGEVRADIFYKAAFYDRSAFMRLK